MIQQRTYNALLTGSAQVTLDASGNGIAVCGPTGVGATWFPSQVGVSTSTAVSNPVAYLYIGPLLPDAALKVLMNTQQVTQIAGTDTGSNDSIGLLSIQIPRR